MGTSASYTPPAVPECPYAARMTRAAALALRAGAGLLENCVVVITDGPAIGTAGNTSATEIELQPSSPSELGLAAQVHTTFDNEAWDGLYDIDLNVFTRLEDNKGNVVDDPAGTNVMTAFPWHNANVVRNIVEDTAVLTNWGGIPVAGVISDNHIFNGAVINFTTAPATMTFDGNIFNGGSYTAFGGNHSVLRSTFTDTVVTRLAGGSSGTQNFFITDSTFQGGSITNSIGGTYSFTRCIAANLVFTITSNRGVTFTDCQFMSATVSQQRTNPANTDICTGLVIEGGSTFTLTGAVDAFLTGATYTNSTITDGSTFTSNAPSGNTQLSGARVGGSSTLNLQGQNARAFRCRLDTASVVNSGNFLHQDTIIELAGTTTLTAANTTRLKNKGFDDTL